MTASASRAASCPLWARINGASGWAVATRSRAASSPTSVRPSSAWPRWITTGSRRSAATANTGSSRRSSTSKAPTEQCSLSTPSPSRSMASATMAPGSSSPGWTVPPPMTGQRPVAGRRGQRGRRLVEPDGDARLVGVRERPHPLDALPRHRRQHLVGLDAVRHREAGRAVGTRPLHERPHLGGQPIRVQVHMGIDDHGARNVASGRIPQLFTRAAGFRPHLQRVRDSGRPGRPAYSLTSCLPRLPPRNRRFSASGGLLEAVEDVVLLVQAALLGPRQQVAAGLGEAVGVVGDEEALHPAAAHREQLVVVDPDVGALRLVAGGDRAAQHDPRPLGDVEQAGVEQRRRRRCRTRPGSRRGWPRGAGAGCRRRSGRGSRRTRPRRAPSPASPPSRRCRSPGRRP